MGRWLLSWLVVATLQALAAGLGPNLVTNGSFETADANGMPAEWTLRQIPAGCATFTLDADALDGTKSLKMSLPDQGRIGVSSRPLPIEGGHAYFFAVAYRTEGYGRKGYEGHNSSIGLSWLNAAGRQIGRVAVAAFPYTPMPWDVRDYLAVAPAAATAVVVEIGLNNDSRKAIEENLPAALWIDAMQLRRYTPDDTPEWAAKRQADNGKTGEAKMSLTNLPLEKHQYLNTKFSTIVQDPASLTGTAITSPENCGKGLLIHGNCLKSYAPGVYRLVVRAKVGDITKTERAGFLDITSEFASTRAALDFMPTAFKAANTYQEFTVDFIIRAPGFWLYRISTEGNQPFTVDSVTAFPLQYFTEQQLRETYPGIEKTKYWPVAK